MRIRALRYTLTARALALHPLLLISIRSHSVGLVVFGSIQFGRFSMPSSSVKSGLPWAYEERLEGPCRKLSFLLLLLPLLSFFCGVSISSEPPQSAGQIETVRLIVQGVFLRPLCLGFGWESEAGERLPFA